jgi:hypothetical protein
MSRVSDVPLYTHNKVKTATAWYDNLCIIAYSHQAKLFMPHEFNVYYACVPKIYLSFKTLHRESMENKQEVYNAQSTQMKHWNGSIKVLTSALSN